MNISCIIIKQFSRLLDILAARKDPYGLTGTVLVDGHPQPANFRLMSGYVVQDDVVMGTLTIKENLRFSADLRLSKDYDSSEKEDRVKRVISELGLGKYANGTNYQWLSMLRSNAKLSAPHHCEGIPGQMFHASQSLIQATSP